MFKSNHRSTVAFNQGTQCHNSLKIPRLPDSHLELHCNQKPRAKATGQRPLGKGYLNRLWRGSTNGLCSASAAVGPAATTAAEAPPRHAVLQSALSRWISLPSRRSFSPRVAVCEQVQWVPHW